MVPRQLLPVGQDLGVRLGDDPVRDDAVRQVRRGASVHELSESEYLVWTVAHGSPEALNDDRTWGRDDVERMSTAAGVADTDMVLPDLLDRGLLVEVAPGTESAVRFAREHRVTPCMLGLGNTAEHPSLFGIGLLNTPILQVDYATYDLWQWSAMDASLWATCESAADVARRAGSTVEAYLDPDKLLTGFLPGLHALLLARAARIDVTFRLDRPDLGQGAS